MPPAILVTGALHRHRNHHHLPPHLHACHGTGSLPRHLWKYPAGLISHMAIWILARSFGPAGDQPRPSQKQQFSRHFRFPIHRSFGATGCLLANAHFGRPHPSQPHRHPHPKKKDHISNKDLHLRFQHAALCQFGADNNNKHWIKFEDLRVGLGNPGPDKAGACAGGADSGQQLEALPGGWPPLLRPALADDN